MLSFLVTVVPSANLVISLDHNFRANMKASSSPYSKQFRWLSLDHFFLLTVFSPPFTFHSSMGLDTTSSCKQLQLNIKFQRFWRSSHQLVKSFCLEQGFLTSVWLLRSLFYLNPAPVGFPDSLQIARQCRRYRRRGFHPWARKIPWRSKWQPTPVFWPGESHGQRSLMGYSP